MIDAKYHDATIRFEKAAKFDIANAETRPGVIR
jgi:hypothetical protein